jgi:hypothetical protein
MRYDNPFDTKQRDRQRERHRQFLATIRRRDLTGDPYLQKYVRSRFGVLPDDVYRSQLEAALRLAADRLAGDEGVQPEEGLLDHVRTLRPTIGDAVSLPDPLIEPLDALGPVVRSNFNGNAGVIRDFLILADEYADDGYRDPRLTTGTS